MTEFNANLGVNANSPYPPQPNPPYQGPEVQMHMNVGVPYIYASHN